MDSYIRMDLYSCRLIIHLFFIIAISADIFRKTVGFLSLFGLTIAPLCFSVRSESPKTAAVIGTIGMTSVATPAQAKKLSTEATLDFNQKQHSLQGCKPPETVIRIKYCVEFPAIGGCSLLKPEVAPSGFSPSFLSYRSLNDY